MHIKKLSESVKKDIELKNYARIMAGLQPIVVKVRVCEICCRLFESYGKMSCGCDSVNNNKPVAGSNII